MKQIPYQRTEDGIDFSYANEIIPERFREGFYQYLHENLLPRTMVLGSDELRCNPYFIKDYLMLNGIESQVIREDENHLLRDIVGGRLKDLEFED